jgi:DNA polymerase-4
MFPMTKTIFGNNLDINFNPEPSKIIHVDINSCFASIEQQANPNLRGKPLAVAAYTTPRGCILAASVEAKRLGVRTGMRVKDGRALCPSLVVVPPDTDKYRFVHHSLHRLLSYYTPIVIPKSIDEFVLDFHNTTYTDLFAVGHIIKSKIRREIGDWLTVSIGIGPSRFLAKVASNLKKPDGLESIDSDNYLSVYSRLNLIDLHGINTRLLTRLNTGKIYTVADFLNSSLPTLRSIFHSIAGYYWFLRLRGYEIDSIDFSRKSFGNMYSLPVPTSDLPFLAPILHKLVAKTTFRLRSHGYHARGLYLSLLFQDHSFWHHHYSLKRYLFDEADIYQLFFRLLSKRPSSKKIINIGISCFDLQTNNIIQLDLFNSVKKSLSLSSAIDDINRKYGSFVVSPAAMAGTESLVPDRIGFGNIDHLTEI